jgi:hypothetical protein
MSVLLRADLLKGARARLASQRDRPFGPSVLPPFPDNVYEDFKQTLSKEEQTICDFFKDKNLTALS